MTVKGNVIWQGSGGSLSLQVNHDGIWLVSTQKNQEILLHEYPDLLTTAIGRILYHEDYATALLGKKPNLVAVTLTLKGNREERSIQLVFQATGNILWKQTISFTEAYGFLNVINNHW